MPVFGPDKELQLVYADDVAEAVAVALESPAEHGGKIFELGGPEKVTMLELNRRIADAQRRSAATDVRLRVELAADMPVQKLVAQDGCVPLQQLQAEFQHE